MSYVFEIWCAAEIDSTGVCVKISFRNIVPFQRYQHGVIYDGTHHVRDKRLKSGDLIQYIGL